VKRAAFSLSLALGVALLGAPKRAAADASPAEKAAAEALFREAVAFIEQDQIGPACEKFAASQAIDPALGTMLRLADCYDRAGKTASAWALFDQAASTARSANQPERERIAVERAKELESRLSKVAVSLTGAAPPGLEVRLNGEVIPIASLGTALPVDPGPLEVELRAEGYKPLEKRFEIAMGPSSATLELPALEPAPKDYALPAGGSADGIEASPKTAASPGDDPGSTQRVFAYVTGGVGIAGLVASGVLGYKAYDANQTSLDRCLSDEPNACTSEGKSLRDDARTFGNFATVAGATGGALLAVSVVLFVTAPSAEPRRETAARSWIMPYVSPRDARVEVGGRF
jgi:hypothetical protein